MFFKSLSGLITWRVLQQAYTILLYFSSISCERVPFLLALSLVVFLIHLFHICCRTEHSPPDFYLMQLCTGTWFNFKHSAGHSEFLPLWMKFSTFFLFFFFLLLCSFFCFYSSIHSFLFYFACLPNYLAGGISQLSIDNFATTAKHINYLYNDIISVKMVDVYGRFDVKSYRMNRDTQKGPLRLPTQKPKAIKNFPQPHCEFVRSVNGKSRSSDNLNLFVLGQS